MTQNKHLDNNANNLCGYAIISFLQQATPNE